MAFIIADNFYIYYYLRSKSSQTADVRTPYYVGKGGGAYMKHYAKVPKDRINIVFVAEGLSEQTAFELETIHIKFWGRKDLRTVATKRTYSRS